MGAVGLEDPGEVAAGGRVEVGARLVADDDVGAHGEDPGECGAALLADREVVRGAVGEVGQADFGEGGGDAGGEFGPAQAEVGGAEAHVVGDGGHEQLVVRALEDDADAAADLGEGLPRHLDARDRHVAGGGGEEPGEVEHERGLPGAVGSEDGDAFAGAHLEVDAVEGAVAVRVDVLEGPDAQGRSRIGGHARTAVQVATAAASAGTARAADHWRALAGAGPTSSGRRPV